MSNKYLIIFFAFLILYIVHTNSRLKNIEGMSNQEQETIKDEIKKTVNDIYLADIQSIRNLSRVSEQLQKGGIEIPGNLTVKGSFNYLPKGTIVAFNGKTAPSGWAVCNGKNGTPDLRGRFIYGYGNGEGKVFGKKGGVEKHKLTVSELPSHNHSMQNAGNHNHRTIDEDVWAGKKFGKSNGAFSGGGKAAIGFATQNNHIYYTSTNGNHTHKVNNTGSNKPHNNMPPYYVLTYIMKL